MNTPSEQMFTPRRSFRRIWMMIAGFGIFIPIGLVIYFTTGETEGLIFSGFGLLPVLYLVYRVLAPGSCYSISQEGVLLKHGRLKRLIPLDEIRGAAVVSADQAEKMLHRYMEPGIVAERAWDMKGSVEANKAFLFFTQFCTVPIVQESSSRGRERNIVRFGARMAGSFVILKLVSKEEYLISPVECEQFFTALSTLTRLADTNPKADYAARPGAVQGKRLRRFFKWYPWISVPALLLILLLRSMLDVYLHPGDDGSSSPKEESVLSVQGDEALQSGWTSPHSFRFTTRANMEFQETDDMEYRRHELAVTAVQNSIFSFTTEMISWYGTEAGLDQELDQEEETWAVLEELLYGAFTIDDITIVTALYNEAGTELTILMELTRDDLQASIRLMLDQGIARTLEQGDHNSPVRAGEGP